MYDYYLRVEAVNLDLSVYDTNDISTIRGASFMLHNVFKGAVQEQAKLSLPCTDFKDIGSAASVGLFSFGTDEKDIQSTIVDPLLNKILQDVKSFATVVWSVYRVRGNEPFPTILQHLIADCRWKQYRQPSLVIPLEKEREHFCPIDGVRPAAVPERIGDKQELVSTAVEARRSKGRSLRNRIYKELLKEDVSNLPDDPDSWIFTNSFESLSRRKEADKLDGKIAFIYLDGNWFGKIRDEKCLNADLYNDFQRKIQDELRNEALQKILGFALKPENKPFRTDDDRIRLETLLWGGDEIEWIVPAWEALNVLELFFEATKGRDFEGAKLTHSGGVVFCSHKLPILQIRRYAHELCRLAKNTIPQIATCNEIRPDANRFAFLNIVSFDYITGTMKEFIERYYRPASVGDFIVHAESVEDIKKYLPELKNLFPANKLHLLLGALQKQKYDDVNEICMNVKRGLSGSQLQLMATAHDKLIAGMNNNWFKIAELMDYVE